MASDTAQRDGSVSFTGGVNSIATTTVGDEPGRLNRTELAWLANGTVRDGGITQRAGILKTGTIQTGDYLFQGATMYEPIGANPYIIASVSGNILRIDPDTAAVTNLSAAFGLTNPATEPHAYFQQADIFLIIQAGDNVTLPLFWDGTTLRRSNGITGNVAQPGATVYELTITSWASIPSVGNTRTWNLDAIYPGIVGDVGVYQLQSASGWNFGTFEVTAFTAVAPFTVTFETVASDRVGQYINMLPATFTLTAVPAPVPINEIPAATAMDYYGGRLFYAIGRVISAGDIVYSGFSGTAAYNFRDSVLKVTENPLAVTGDGFEVPSQDGNIRAIEHGAAIDAALGQGRLFIFTRKAVYSLQVPVNRQDWIDATADNQPLMTVVQLNNGSVNDRCVVAVNGDLFYQSLEPSIRSLDQSVRNFNQAGNRNLSANEQRILQFNDRSLLREATGIYFNNRLLESALPRETPSGVVHDALVPLDFIPISTFNQLRQPNWEGHYEGVPIFQMLTADFGGRERAFALVYGTDNSLQLWEFTTAEKFDLSMVGETQNRVDWYIEFPAFTWRETIGEAELKKLIGGELWIDRLFGTVIFTLDYRPDGATCWLPWAQWEECSPKNTNETVGLPVGYPVALNECYKATMILPRPDPACAPCNNARPANIAYQFQVRLSIKGFCRIRGFWMWAEPVQRGTYQPSIIC